MVDIHLYYLGPFIDSIFRYQYGHRRVAIYHMLRHVHHSCYCYSNTLGCLLNIPLARRRNGASLMVLRCTPGVSNRGRSPESSLHCAPRRPYSADSSRTQTWRQRLLLQDGAKRQRHCLRRGKNGRNGHVKPRTKPMKRETRRWRRCTVSFCVSPERRNRFLCRQSKIDKSMKVCMPTYRLDALKMAASQTTLYIAHITRK